MGYDRKARYAEEHHADPVAVAGAGVEPSRKRLAVFAPELALKPRVRKLRRHHRRRR